jgi:hypothetical protein
MLLDLVNRLQQQLSPATAKSSPDPQQNAVVSKGDAPVAAQDFAAASASAIEQQLVQ